MIDETNLNMAIDRAEWLKKHMWSSAVNSGPAEWNSVIYILEFLKSLKCKGENNDNESKP